MRPPLTRLPCYCRAAAAAAANTNNSAAAAAVTTTTRTVSSASSVANPTDLPAPAPIPSEAGTFDKTPELKRKLYRSLEDSPVSEMKKCSTFSAALLGG